MIEIYDMQYKHHSEQNFEYIYKNICLSFESLFLAIMREIIMHSSVHLFIQTVIHLFTDSFIHLFVRSSNSEALIIRIPIMQYFDFSSKA